MPTPRRAGRRGSKVVVTSSDAGHVDGLGTAEPIVLRPLPPEEYWFFFRAHAFGGVEADPRLAATGQAIAKRLGGSFFGGKIVGALRRSRPDARLWRSVLSSSFSIPDVWCRQPPPAACDRALRHRLRLADERARRNPRSLFGSSCPSLCRRRRQPQSGVACAAVQVCVPWLLPVLHRPLHPRQRDQSVKRCTNSSS